MDILDDMQGEVVALDTAPLIYFIEKHATYHPLLRPFFVGLANEQYTAVTSTITLVEALVHPMRLKQTKLAEQYRKILLNSPHITTYDLSPEIAQIAAQIRADYAIRTPDAIQLATAVYANATFFLTNDHALRKYPHLKVLVVNDLV